jgi:dTDP-4-dehydrorhamnose 3,5-epimerase
MSNSIVGVETYSLEIHKDERGAVLHMMRADQPHFLPVKETYFSVVNAGVVKGWKRHLEIFQSMVVPVGMIRLLIYDNRENSPTKGVIKAIDFGVDNYLLVRLPPLVWYSFKAISNDYAMIANNTTAVHDPKESETLPLENSIIPFKWAMLD